MADDTVDTVDTEATSAAPAEATPGATTAPAAADAAPAEKPAKKAAARKAPAKKTAAKKTAADKTPAEKTSGEKASGEKAEKPAKKAPAKKAAAKKTTAKKAAAAPPADEQAPAAEAEADGSPVDETPAAGAAVLFQAPEKKPAAKRTAAKKAAQKPAPKDEEPAAEDEDLEVPATEAPDTADETDETDDTEQGEGTSQAARRRRRRGGRRRRKPSGAGATGNAGDDDDDTPDDESDGAEGQTDGDVDDAGDDKGDDKGDNRGGGRSQGGRSQSGRQGGGKAQGAKAKADSQGKGDADESDADESDADGGEQGEGGSPSSRRRRRRRREGEGGADGGDDPNTVTRVRKPRSAEDEITSISGSTRLEAKKQRRRDGREAGRRRAPIVSEAEFLARRESVERVMVVRQRKDLTQIAVIEDKVLVEHYVARESQTSLIGNVYLGRVQNVLPSMEAAFVDIGKGRNAVLYAGEVNWSALGHKEGTPRKIESVLTSGQTVLVQVTKDPIGHKGARLTSQISLAGRFLVYVPDGTTSGISRKLPDTERGRLKALLKEIVPETAGVIVRTAAEGASEEELTSDVERLKARWEDIESKVAKGNAPQLLYGEPDLTLKVVRDLFTEDFAKLVVQGDDAWDTVREYVEQVAPDLTERLEHYQTSVEGQPDKPDAFATYRIDEQIAKGLDRKVWLPSGGSLVIDRTEAMTVIDVNTGKFTGSGGNLEETVTKNNLEAAEEIVRQLRLRDIGGIIVVDFIDMVLESNRDLVLRRLVECLGRDRTRHQVAEVTSLGLVQMTRKRIGTGLLEAFSETCDHCQGRGILVNDLPVEPRRGGGDESAPRGARRRRGKGNGQADEPAAKAVPSPKIVAAMAKPPAPEADEASTGTDAEETPVEASAAEETPVEASAAEETPVEASAAEETSVEATPAEETPVEATPAEETPVEATPVEETPVEETPVEETPVEEPAAAGVAGPVTTVVTRTRRRAASRPAGPPASAAAPLADPAPEPAPEPHVEHVPIKKKGTRKR